MYSTIGVCIFLGGFVFDVLTSLVIFPNPLYQAPIVVAAVTGVLFQTAWDTWLREVEVASEDVEEESETEGAREAEERSSEAATLEDDTAGSR